jgi:hypothetical protein
MRRSKGRPSAGSLACHLGWVAVALWSAGGAPLPAVTPLARFVAAPKPLPPLPATIAARGDRLRALLAPSAAAKVDQAAAALIAASLEDPLSVFAASEQSAGTFLPPEARPPEIDAVAYVILYQATTDMDRELSTALHDLQAMIAAKETLAQRQSTLAATLVQRRAGAPTLAAFPSGDSAGSSGTPSLPFARERSALLHLEVVPHPAIPELPADLTHAKRDELQQAWQVLETWTPLNAVTDHASLQLQEAQERRGKLVAVLAHLAGRLGPATEAVVHKLK